MDYKFQDISLLITHYNRSSSLERLLLAFEKLQCRFGEVVVSDDGSKKEHIAALTQLQSRFEFKLVGSEVNRGLGHNINKGQDAVTTPYTLYIQEDFVPSSLFPEKLTKAQGFMNERADLDMVRFYAYFAYPFLKPLSDGFSEMLFSPWPWYWGYLKFYYYSDHPHLRRSNFFSKFGRYAEGKKGDVTEYRMMMSFLQKKGKGLFYENFKELFDQVNSDIEPSTMKRNVLRESNNPFIVPVRHLYRHIKFNFDLHTS